MDIFETDWQGFAAVVLESAVMRVVMLPELGAKIVSLLDKVHGYEWLVPPMRPLRALAYGADFVSQDMSGWDEMLPTIVTCVHAGAQLPDHGEVWSLPWRVEDLAGRATLVVDGVALPYRLERSAALVAEDCLELAYTLTNTGTAAFPYLWAAHPQFNAGEHTRIVLPPEARQVVNVIDGDPLWGRAGEMYAWPQAAALDGQTWALDRVRPVEARACRKFYLPPGQPIAAATLVDAGPGCELRLSWSPADLPYFGLWVDEGAYNARAAVAFEPCSAYYDSLERAVAGGRAPVLAPGALRRWAVRVQLGASEGG